MLILEKKLPRWGMRVAVVSEENARDKYNMIRYPCAFEDFGKPIDLSTAEVYFPTMRPLSEVMEVFQYA